MEKQRRNSNIELLRIICMFMIVLGHFLSQSGAQELMHNPIFLAICGNGARISVNIFLIIGCWFMVDRAFSAERILKLYGNVWIYTGGGTIALILFGYRIGFVNIVRNALPFIGGSLWFASAYIALMFLAPFLNHLFLWRRTVLRNLLLILFCLICLETMIRPDIDDWLSWILWFTYVYLCIGYYKKYLYPGKHAQAGLIIGLAMYLCMCGICILADFSVVPHAVGNIAHRYLLEIFVAPNICIAGLIAVFFIQRKPFYSTIINRIGGACFSVYVLHQFRGFYEILWKNIFQSEQWLESAYSPILAVGVVVAVFAGTMILDMVRKRTVEPLWEKSKLFLFLACKINGFYQEMGFPMDVRNRV